MLRYWTDSICIENSKNSNQISKKVWTWHPSYVFGGVDNSRRDCSTRRAWTKYRRSNGAMAVDLYLQLVAAYLLELTLERVVNASGITSLIAAFSVTLFELLHLSHQRHRFCEFRFQIGNLWRCSNMCEIFRWSSAREVRWCVSRPADVLVSLNLMFIVRREFSERCYRQQLWFASSDDHGY